MLFRGLFLNLSVAVICHIALSRNWKEFSTLFDIRHQTSEIVIFSLHLPSVDMTLGLDGDPLDSLSHPIPPPFYRFVISVYFILISFPSL